MSNILNGVEDKIVDLKQPTLDNSELRQLRKISVMSRNKLIEELKNILKCWARSTTGDKFTFNKKTKELVLPVKLGGPLCLTAGDSNLYKYKILKQIGAERDIKIREDINLDKLDGIKIVDIVVTLNEVLEDYHKRINTFSDKVKKMLRTAVEMINKVPNKDES